NQLADFEFQWSSDPAVCVVIASGGYPASYEKGFAISGLDEAAAAGAVVFHAGTSYNDAGAIVNTGGRVLGVTAKGETIQQAVDRAYEAVEKISWDGSFYRKDIAYRALSR
ncbi:MAG: phosphoribosylamine--glycine ligase, partial [Lentisphaeria bacterium]|nr:phosphoribosylamine--glycine ligase [Lentisphaeria bacterium]NQZ66565.1 phosphoribosylamine--glycine ligase [Lentisphaeria bacterium]